MIRGFLYWAGWYLIYLLATAIIVGILVGVVLLFGDNPFSAVMW